MEVVEALIIASIAWIFLIIIAICAKEMLRARLLSDTCIGDIFATSLLCSLVFADYWLLSKFKEGAFINGELTFDEENAPTQSFFILLFYWFLEIALVYLALIAIAFTIVGFIFTLLIHGAEHERSIYHPIARCLGLNNLGRPTGTYD